MIFLYGFILTLVAFIAIGAPVFRSIEHTILFRYPGSIFSTWPKWLQRFLLGHRKPGGTNDGFHWGSGLNDLGCVLTGAIIVSLVETGSGRLECMFLPAELNPHSGW